MEVRNLSVIGAGVMGTGIAPVSALGGIHTTLVDISLEILEKARAKIRGRLQKGMELKKIDQEMMEQALSRLILICSKVLQQFTVRKIPFKSDRIPLCRSGLLFLVISTNSSHGVPYRERRDGNGR